MAHILWLLISWIPSLSQECSFPLFCIMDHMKNSLGFAFEQASVLYPTQITRSHLQPKYSYLLLKPAGCTQPCQQQASCWLHRHSTGLEEIQMIYFKAEKVHSLFPPCKGDPLGQFEQNCCKSKACFLPWYCYLNHFYGTALSVTEF